MELLPLFMCTKEISQPARRYKNGDGSIPIISYFLRDEWYPEKIPRENVKMKVQTSPLWFVVFPYYRQIEIFLLLWQFYSVYTRTGHAWMAYCFPWRILLGCVFISLQLWRHWSYNKHACVLITLFNCLLFHNTFIDPLKHTYIPSLGIFCHNIVTIYWQYCSPYFQNLTILWTYCDNIHSTVNIYAPQYG